MPLSLPVPDLVSLDLLRSVGEHGSIRQAAMAHNVSQPAASMRLRTLEKTLGLTLLDRRNGHAKLTQAGMAVVEWSAQILDGVSELLVGSQALRQAAENSLKIAASVTVAEFMVPVWLTRFRSSGGATSVSLQMGNTEQVTEIIRSQRADIGFVEGRSVPGDLTHRTVAVDDLVVVVAPSHPWAHRKKSVTARELAATPLILREVGSGTREVFDKAMEAQGYEPVAMAELGSNTAIKAMVSSGAGPGVLSRTVAKSDVENGRLVIAQVRGVSLERSIRAIWSKSKGLPISAKRLLNSIRDGHSGGEASA